MKLIRVPIELIDVEIAPESKSQQLSLMELEQIAPVTLAEKDGRYIIIDGRRRIVDLIANGAKEVLAIVKSLASQTEIDWQTLVLNSGSHNEIGEAEVIQRLVDAGYTQADIAKKINYTQATVSQRLRVIDKLSPNLIEKVKQGAMKYSAALKATYLPRDIQDSLEDLTFAAVQTRIKQEQAKRLQIFDDIESVTYNDNLSQESLIVTSEQLQELRDGKSVKLYFGAETFEMRRL